MELLNDGVQLRGAADLLQELEESASADQVKRLNQVYEGKVKRLVLLLAFLLQLSHRENHVSGGSAGSEPVLGLEVDTSL